MNDEQILDYLNELFKNNSFVELRYSSFNECFVLDGPRLIEGYGKTIQEAAEDFKKKAEQYGRNRQSVRPSDDSS